MNTSFLGSPAVGSCSGAAGGYAMIISPRFILGGCEACRHADDNVLPATIKRCVSAMLLLHVR